MHKCIKLLILFIFLLLTSSSVARQKLIGNIVKNTLENYHYRKLRIDDNLSKKAFNEYINFIDGRKQFLLKSDVSLLKKHYTKIDDQIANGKYDLVNDSISVLNTRIRDAEKVRQELFKKPFEFKFKEKLELDVKKRKFLKTNADFKDRWRKIFKYAVLLHYTGLKEQNTENKNNQGKKNAKKPKKIQTNTELKKESYKAISKRYKNNFKRLLKRTKGEYISYFYNAVSMVFDPHTSYLMPKSKEDFDLRISGKLEGIGATLQEDGSFIKVVSIIPGGAAWRQKELEVDDIILMVAQGSGRPLSLVDMRVEDAVRYIRGKKGTKVRLTVKKADGRKKVISIIRDEVQVEEIFVKSSVIKDKKTGTRVGYIVVPKFYRNFSDNSNENSCTYDVKRAIEKLKKENIDGLVLDLRLNGGGALEDARTMTGLFIKSGPIVQVRDSFGKVNTLFDEDSTVYFKKPMVVLVSKFTASASEILAGALQDYNRAVIVGSDFSHGKGTVQAVLDLNRGPIRHVLNNMAGALKITIQKFYRVTGNSTQRKGVIPDIILPSVFDGFRFSREKDLDYSLPWDTIKAKTYSKWGSFPYDLSFLKKKSLLRVNNNISFKKLKAKISYLNNVKDDTVVTLNEKDYIKDQETRDKKIKQFEDKTEYKNLIISSYHEAFMAKKNFNKAEVKSWSKLVTARKKEWTSNIQKDVILAEAINIMSDMINYRPSVAKIGNN